MCYLADLRKSEQSLHLLNEHSVASQTEVVVLSDHIHVDQSPDNRMTSILKESELMISPARGEILSYYLLALGIITFGICLTAAIGKSAINELRGPSVIGCDHWYLLGGSNS